MAGEEKRDLPFGVGIRKETEKLYFEMRIDDVKLYSTKITTPEEGALCFDIATRYKERWSDEAATGRVGVGNGERRKRKACQKLNYPDYSGSLVLRDVPNVRDNKEEVMESILGQAQAAAVGLPKQMQAGAANRRVKVQKQAAHDVGSHGVGNRVSSPQSIGSASRGAKEHPDLACRLKSTDFQVIDNLCKHLNGVTLAYTSKFTEMGELEQKVKDIKEGSGLISFREGGPDKFHELVASIKQHAINFPSLEACEQEYTSMESECCKLRKILDDHNSKSIHESLKKDGNKMTGRRRANENERLPPVPEMCPTEELNNWDVNAEVSTSDGLPANPLVQDVVPHAEQYIGMPSDLETDISQLVASHNSALPVNLPIGAVQGFWGSLLSHAGCRRENEDEGPAEVFDDNWVDEFFSDYAGVDSSPEPIPQG